MNPALIRLENIVRTYHVGEVDVRALRGITYNVLRGDFVAIMGPSGSGKSTLMNILGCLDRPTSGTYFIDDQAVSRLSDRSLAILRNTSIGFVFQSFNLLKRTSARENVELPMLYADVSGKQSRERALKALKLVGLEGRETHNTNQLSGGEQQRVAIARSLVNNPSLILADEPTGNLDSKMSEDVMKIVLDMNREKKITIILVTHESDIAAYANRVIHVKDGLIDREDVKFDIRQGGTR
ncbi:MAG: ABC transporter ATP-binding protein [Candidatus Aminicenantales bacterium]|jgi:putative ABC transport system ATP-binding protein